MEKVAQEVADDQTLHYITQLESEQKNLRQQLKDVNLDLQQTKVRIFYKLSFKLKVQRVDYRLRIHR